MPLDIPMPWLRGPNVEGAISSGAAAGESAARIEQAGRAESGRLAMESQQLQERSQAEAARLSQAEHMAQMEAATRREIAQQNQLRESQRLAITTAYHQAQIGMEKGRIEQQQAIAEQKAKEAAMTFQRNQGFAKAIAAGVPVMEAYKQFPVSPSLLGAVSREQGKPERPKDFNTRGGIVRVNPDGTIKELYKPPVATPDVSVLGAAGEESAPPTPGIISRIKNVFSPSAPPVATAAPSAKDKLVRAHALGIAHPDWTKEQIVDAVNKEMP